jgi:hypothetical protein|tara:strand:+ start:661 stop:1062 length:402 start_codon:yes stop_codon:yes gene_type:complete
MLANINVRPKYEVYAMDGEREVTKISFKRVKLEGTDPVKYKLRRVEKKKKVPNGFMVYFPRGHSIHVTTEKELKRLGLDGSPMMVDMDSGEDVPIQARSLRDMHNAHQTVGDVRQRFRDSGANPVEDTIHDTD